MFADQEVRLFMFEPPMETMDREALQKVQVRRLRSLVGKMLLQPEDAVRLRTVGLTDGAEVDIDTLTDIPFMDKSHIIARYPLKGFDVATHDIVEWHGSSGTGGRETLVPYTRDDLHTWGLLCARLLVAAGVTRKSLAVNAYGYGLFTGGLGYHYGLGQIGAAVIPLGIGSMARQVRLLRDLPVDALACTPTFALRLADYLATAGVSADELHLKVGIFGAEAWSEARRETLERALGLCAFDLYGLSEVMGPGVAGECSEERRGLHVNEDHFLAEIVDPQTGEARADGELGELVLTTLTKQAAPVLRYRTGDLASLSTETCSCGRTFSRISRIQGRRDDMLVVNGTNLFPRDIEEVILATPGLSGEFAVVLCESRLPPVIVACEFAAETPDEEYRYRLQAAITERVGIRVSVAFVPSGAVVHGDAKRGRRVLNWIAGASPPIAGLTPGRM